MRWIALPIIGMFISACVCAQSTSSQPKIPSRYLEEVSSQSSSIYNDIDKKSAKLIKKLKRHEEKLQHILAKIDPLFTKSFFSETTDKYSAIYNKLTRQMGGFDEKMGGEYLAGFDSLKVSLSFLNTNKNFLPASQSQKLNDAMQEVSQLQSRFKQAETIKELIKERTRQLQEVVSRYTWLPANVERILSKYKSDAYYYSTLIRSYKETFRDPDKIQRMTLAALNKIPAFQTFLKEHSELGGLFSLPRNYGTAESLTGLQTKEQLRQLISNKFGNGTNSGQVLSQQIQAAQSQLDKFKEKLGALGAGSGDIEMPNFKPNTQRTKTFLRRLEYGINFQSTKSYYFLPSTTDIALTVGYRIDDKKTVGFGMAGKIGWGKDLKHIVISGEGLSLRSFIDIQIKKSFYASGGFEFNYQKVFLETQDLYRIDDWSKSGLLGITKIVSMKSKVFKKTRVQLLWDWLSYSQRPRPETPFKFRVGYNF